MDRRYIIFVVILVIMIATVWIHLLRPSESTSLTIASFPDTHAARVNSVITTASETEAAPLLVAWENKEWQTWFQMNSTGQI